MDNRQKKRIMAEEIWLNYYNRYLFEKHYISEEDRNRMQHRITCHCNKKRNQEDRDAQ